MKMMVMALAMFVLASGCSTTHSEYSRTDVVSADVLGRLQGEPRSVVVDMLGKPTRELDSKGDTYWEYAGAEQIIVVQFSRRDLQIVNQVNAGTSKQEAYLPWTQTLMP